MSIPDEYVLITPARNEEDFIEMTIRSVISQSVLPKRWVIVSDGSTDKTDKIVLKYAEENDWIILVRLPEHRDRQFAAKVHAFNAGYHIIKDLQYNIIGNLDADITFDESYFEFLLNKFSDNLSLGVSGTPFVEDSSRSYNYEYTNIEHVSGACQLFRRECFEEIGGYVPIKGGGIDWTAVTTARMKGWETRTFTEKRCFHHRKIGTGNSNHLSAWFKHGYKDYYLGGHPLWQIFRCFYQMSSKPYIICGLYLLSGFFWAFLTRVEKPVSKDLISFHRSEQMARLHKIINNKLFL